MLKQMGDLLQEAREIGNVGAVYLVTGEFDNAIGEKRILSGEMK